MSISSAKNEVSIKPTTYDTVVSALTALIALKAVAVLTLFLIWMVQETPPSPIVDPGVLPPAPVEEKEAPDPEESETQPGAKEFPEVAPDVTLREELQSIDDLVSTVLADQEPTGGLGEGLDGEFEGRGYPETIPPQVVEPVWKRWRITFQVENLETYRRMLDQLEIQIGVVANEPPDVWRVSNASTTPAVSQSTREQERGTLMFRHKKPRLRKWDFQIAAEAGVPIEKGFPLVQFYSDELREKLVQLEAEYLERVQRKLEDVSKTNLRLQANGKSFQFVVEGCEFR